MQSANTESRSLHENPKYLLHRTTVHPIISTSFATLATWSLALILGDIVVVFRQSVLFYLLIPAICVEESVVGNMLEEERAGVLARIREFLIIALASYVVLGSVRPGSIITRYFPTILSIYPVVIIAIGWVIAAGLHKRLRSREEFVRATARTRRRDLHHAIRELTAVSTRTLGDLRRVRGLGLSILLFLVVLLVLGWSIGAAIRSITVVAFAGCCLCYIAILALLSVFADEFIYLGDGLRVSRVDMKRKLVVATILIAVGATFAFVAASDRSVFSLDVFGRFFEWLASLLPEPESGTSSPLSLNSRQLQNIEALRELEEMMQDQEPSRLWLALLRTIRMLVIAAAFVGLAVLVVGPFLSEEFAERVRRARPIDAVLRRASAVAQFLKRMVRSLRRWWRGVDARRFVRSLMRSNATVAEECAKTDSHGLRKRRQLSHVSERFLALIAWSSERGLNYRKSFVPTEYGERLRGGFPQITQEIDTAIEVFEEALYSDHVIPGRRMRAFNRAIDAIVKSEY